MKKRFWFVFYPWFSQDFELLDVRSFKCLTRLVNRAREKKRFSLVFFFGFLQDL